MSQQKMQLMMDLHARGNFLGGLSPSQFMRGHWHKTPLLIRQALPDVVPPLPRSALFALSARDDVESRLVLRDGRRWRLRQGPLPRRALPPLNQPHWTLLVQGLDLHVDAAHELLSRFRFVPDARLDDLMLSYASDGGGVGPHVDSYDVFLIQVAGRRRWRYGRCDHLEVRDDVPLKMLARFEPMHDHVLERGDMLYLPPGWAHDGVAIGGECLTASVGFRAPTQSELARALLDGIAEVLQNASPRYRDPSQRATAHAAEVPEALLAYGRRALARALAQPGAVEQALGVWLTEPQPQVWFDAAPRATLVAGAGLVLDRRTRMAYDRRQIYINGEPARASGRDALLMRRLADARRLGTIDAARLSAGARALLGDWLAAGWLHLTGDANES